MARTMRMTRTLAFGLMLGLWFGPPGCGGGQGEGGDLTPGDGAVGDATEAPAGEDTGLDAAAVVPPKVEIRNGFRLIWLSGTPHEMGVQQGELLHDEIREAMEFVAADPLLSAIPELVEDMGVLDILEARALPEVIEECGGLVEAAGDTGLDMRACLVLNMGDVALSFIENGIPPEAGPGCSSVVAAGPATKDGRLYHARNLDWGSMDIGITQKYPVIQVRQPAGGIPHVFIGFPLNLSPYTGMNAAGVSLGTHEASPAGVSEMTRAGRSNVQLTARMLREARSLAEVEAIVRAEGHMTSGILVAADGQGGTGAVFELTATAVEMRPLQGGLVYATNHFVSEAMVPKGDRPGKGSLGRFARLGQLLDPSGPETRYGEIDPAVLADVMQDVKDPETGATPTEEELAAVKWDTDTALGANGPMHLAIFDPARRLFWVAAGLPPLHSRPYECFSLDELLGRPDAAPCTPARL